MKKRSKRQEPEQEQEWPPMWKVVETDRGYGFQCPKTHCGGKLVLNLDLVKETRPQLGTRRLMCPYCECLSDLPKVARV